ncbi:MAG: carboxypeptidase M32 [Planctomycetota bacterium]
MPASAYESLCAHARETALLTSTAGLLQWDEETYLPPAGGAYRAEQCALLAGLIHQRQTDPRVGEWLDELESSGSTSDPRSDAAANVRGLRRDYDKKTKLPPKLVEELSRTASLGQQAWKEARQADDFTLFQPMLEKTIELKQQEAEAIGYEASPYDALLDDYEPGETAANVARVLGGLREQLAPLVEKIAAAEKRPDGRVLSRHYPVARQEAFGKRAAAAIGFDFDAGRLDVTAHPFCGGAGPRDVRITTRYDDHEFAGALFGTLHEAGHGLYEQGLPAGDYGLPLGEAVSLGIHESQSRMWENLVGRSQAFWRHFFAPFAEAFPDALAGVTEEAFYFAVNESKPSLIRTESDEATYNLHIIVRFELEQALLADDLLVADLPEAWNAKYREYLGIVPPNAADGVLQDVHWSAGLFGYFPTYTLGNLYASQFFDQAGSDLGDLEGQFSRGDFQPLRDWLRTNIHRDGRRYSAGQLVERVTGKPLSHEPLMAHLSTKYGRLYGFD